MLFSSSSVAAVIIYVVWSFYSIPVYMSPEGRKDIHVLLQWKQLDFDYPSPTERQSDIDSGIFKVGKITPIDVDVHYVGRITRIFITVPRTFGNGVPATLGTVTSKTLRGNPLIAPFPSWRWHKNLEECPEDRIVSVFRTITDACGRLWVLDTGKINSSHSCPPQILAFDAQTGEVLHKYEIPSSQLQSNNLLVTPVVDVEDEASGCRNTFIYVADCTSSTLLVYDVKRNTSWVIRDRTFLPDPDYNSYNIAGESFEVEDGILGMSVTQNSPEEKGRLFYHAMSSTTENWVYTDFLKNQTLFQNNPEAAPQIFNTYKNRRDTQSAAEATDRNGIMYYGLLGDIKIACFNTRGEYGSRNSSSIIGNNQVTMQFPSGIKVITNARGKQELWVLTSRYQKTATGTLDPRETNFRILAGSVDSLIAGSACEQ